MKRKIEHYIHLYPGCRIETVDGPGINLGHYWPDVWLQNGQIEPNGVVVGFPQKKGKTKMKVVVMNYGQCVLRPTSIQRLRVDHAHHLVKMASSLYHDVTIQRGTFDKNGFWFNFRYKERNRRYNGHVRYASLNSEQFHFLLKQGYDVFGISNMKLNTPGEQLKRVKAKASKEKIHGNRRNKS